MGILNYEMLKLSTMNSQEGINSSLAELTDLQRSRAKIVLR